MKDSHLKKPKRQGLLFVLQILFLVFSFFVVLWAQMRLKDISKNSQSLPLERKAKLIIKGP